MSAGRFGFVQDSKPVIRQPQSGRSRSFFAGTPPQISKAPTDFVSTEPAAMIAP